MSYIQCKNEKEVEATLAGKTGFVTEDFRIYPKIDFWDDVCVHHLDADEIDALLSLKQNIECVAGGMWETNFNKLVEDAEMVRKSYLRCAEILKKRELKIV